MEFRVDFTGEDVLQKGLGGSSSQDKVTPFVKKKKKKKGRDVYSIFCKVL